MEEDVSHSLVAITKKLKRQNSDFVAVCNDKASIPRCLCTSIPNVFMFRFYKCLKYLHVLHTERTAVIKRFSFEEVDISLSRKWLVNETTVKS